MLLLVQADVNVNMAMEISIVWFVPKTKRGRENDNRETIWFV